MRSPLLVLVSAAVVGVVVGASGPLLISAGGQVGHVAHLVLSAGWSWAALAFFAGMSNGSKVRAAAAGAISLVVAVLAYYATKAGQGEFIAVDLSDHTGQTTFFSWGEFLSGIALWGVSACLLGPVLGLAGHLARTGPYRLFPRLLVPLVVIAEMTMRLRDEAPLQGALVATTWSVTRIMALVAVLALVTHAALGAWRRRSGKEVPLC